MVRGAIASVALGAAMLGQSGAALCEPSPWNGPVILAQAEAPQPEKQGAQPPQGAERATCARAGSTASSSRDPETAGRHRVAARQGDARSCRGTTKPKPKPRVAAKPAREAPRAVVRPAPARPATRCGSGGDTSGGGGISRGRSRRSRDAGQGQRNPYRQGAGRRRAGFERGDRAQRIARHRTGDPAECAGRHHQRRERQRICNRYSISRLQRLARWKARRKGLPSTRTACASTKSSATR